MTLNHYYMDTVNKIKADSMEMQQEEMKADGGYTNNYSGLGNSLHEEHGQELYVSARNRGLSVTTAVCMGHGWLVGRACQRRWYSSVLLLPVRWDDSLPCPSANGV